MQSMYSTAQANRTLNILLYFGSRYFAINWPKSWNPEHFQNKIANNNQLKQKDANYKKEIDISSEQKKKPKRKWTNNQVQFWRTRI